MDKKTRTIGLLALFGAYIIVYIHRIMTGVIKPELESMATSHGWDPVSFSAAVASFYFYAYALMQLPGGVLADVLGIRKYVALSLTMMSLGTILLSAPDPYVVLIGRLLIGAGAASVFISIQRYTGVYYEKNMGGKITGIAVTAGNLGAVIATTPVRLIVDKWGMFSIILLLFMFSIIFTITSAAFIKDPGLARIGFRKAFGKTIDQLKIVVKTSHSWSVALVHAATYAQVVAFQAYWGQDYFSMFSNNDPTKTSYFLLMIALSFAILTPVVGWISDNVLGRRKPIMISSVIMHIVTWLLYIYFIKTHTTSLYIIPWILAFLLGFAAALTIATPPMAREAYPPEFSGTTFAFVNLIGFLSIAIYQSLASLVSSVTEMLYIFSVIGFIALIFSFKARETLD